MLPLYVAIEVLWIKTYVTGFAKRGLPHTSNLQTLAVHNLRLEKGSALKFGQ